MTVTTKILNGALDWINHNEGADCNYDTARLSLGDGVDVLFQRWHSPPIGGYYNARMEPGRDFWAEYEAKAAAIGWSNIEPWFIEFRERQIARIDEFCATVEKVLGVAIIDRDREFLAKTRGNGVLHFSRPHEDATAAK